MKSPACKKDRCEECENMACKCPCHFLPPDEEIIEEDYSDDGLDEEEDAHLEDGEGEEDIF